MDILRDFVVGEELEEDQTSTGTGPAAGARFAGKQPP